MLALIRRSSSSVMRPAPPKLRCQPLVAAVVTAAVVLALLGLLVLALTVLMGVH